MFENTYIGHGLTIAVFNSEELCTQLTRHGYIVTNFSNYVTHGAYDLIIINYQSKILQQLDIIEDVPVIVIECINNEQRNECFKYGASEAFTDNTTFAEILFKIGMLLQIKLLKEQINYELTAHKQAETALKLVSNALKDANNKIHSYNQELIAEQTLAKKIYDNIVVSGNNNDPQVNYYASPFSIFNGDALFVCRNINQELLVFLGDMSGHGLPAAMGVIPVAETIYELFDSNASFEEIITTANLKLLQTLPLGMYCAANIILIKDQVAKVWNGGCADALCFNKSGEQIAIISSTHVPLGILDSLTFDSSYQEINLDNIDFVYLFSDGLIEVHDNEQQLLGVDNLKKIIQQKILKKEQLEYIIGMVENFSATNSLSDDVTLVEIFNL